MTITTQESNKRSIKRAFARPQAARVEAISTKQSVVRQGVIYGSIFVLLTSFIAYTYYRPSFDKSAGVSSVAAQTVAANEAAVAIDQKVATDVAANFAIRTQMSVAPNVANLSTSLETKKDMAQEDDTIISKPAIVQPAADDRAVITYKAKTGDTAQSVAGAHGISVQTLKWANNLESDSIEDGRELTVPPVDGVVYTVQEGDTVQSLAERYKAPVERIVSFNDLEMQGVAKDMRIVIPGGVKPAEPAPTPVPQPGRTSNGQRTGSFSSTANIARARASAGNAYAPGNCTWYAFERRAQLGRPIGSFWGNASTWASNGTAAGFAVNRTPAPGAIMQNGGGYAGYGHVAIVETLNPDGSITVSEMNYAGFNVVSSRTIPVGQIGNYRYIH